MKRKSSIYFTLGFILILLFFMAISYGFWKYEFLQSNWNTGSTPCLKMNFEEKNEGIQLLEAYPLNDEEGRKLTPYIFTVTNTCKDVASYQVNLENILHDKKELPLSYVKVKLNGNTPNILNHHTKVEPYLENAKEAYKLTTGVLKEDESVTYELRLWLDESTPASKEVSEASFLSKITIAATPDKVENIANEIQMFVELKEFLESEQKQIVDIQAISENHNLIGYTFCNEKKDADELKNISWNTIVPESKNHHVIHEYYDNGTYYVYYKDEKGNIKEQEIIVNTFDRTGPEILEVSTDDEWGIENSITVIAQDERSGIIGYAFTSSDTESSSYHLVDGGKEEKTFTYSVQENGTYYVWLKDSIGNVTHQEIVVSKIDKVLPSSSFSINNSTPGNNGWYKSLSVRVVVIDNESGVSSSKYCITTEETCIPNKDAVINAGSYVVTLGSNSRAQRVCSVVIDNVGNMGSVQCDSFSYFVDTQKPLIASVGGGVMTQGENGWWKELSLIATGRDSQSGIFSSKYCITTGNSCVPNQSATLNGDSVTINYGSNASAQRFCINFTDRAGNESEVWCDPTAYSVDVNNPTANIGSTSVSLNSITISAGGSSDNIGISTYYYSLDNVNWYSSSSNVYTFSSLGDNYYTVYVKVKDWSGRESAVVSKGGIGVAYNNVYVSSSGNDSNYGTKEYPLATIQKGYSNVKSGGNIILLSNITANNQTNFDTVGKVATLKSDGSARYAINRSNSFTNASILSVSNSNIVDIYSVYFDGCNVSSISPILYITGQNTFVNLNGNTYVVRGINNSQWQGGGVSVVDNAHLNIKGAQISNNRTRNQGGGVYVSNATAVLSNGSIQDNGFTGEENGAGGGVFLYYANFTMTNGVIYHNSAYNGAGISADNSKVNYSGGKIMDNTASYRGGAAQIINNSNMTIDNADIFGNSGGAIAIRSNSTLIMNSGTIQNNTSSTTMAAGVDSDNGSFAFNGGSIINNKCTGSSTCPAGVRIYKSTYLTTGNQILGGNTPKDFWQGN